MVRKEWLFCCSYAVLIVYGFSGVCILLILHVFWLAFLWPVLLVLKYTVTFTGLHYAILKAVALLISPVRIFIIIFVYVAEYVCVYQVH